MSYINLSLDQVGEAHKASGCPASSDKMHPDKNPPAAVPWSPATTACPSPALSHTPNFRRLFSGDSDDFDKHGFMRTLSGDEELDMIEENDSDDGENVADSKAAALVSDHLVSEDDDQKKSTGDDEQVFFKKTAGEDGDAEAEETYDLGPNKRVVKSETGIRWIVAGPTPSASSLERQLNDVKEMYKRKTGQDVDDEEEEYDLGPSKRVVKSETGIRWIVAGPTPSASSIERQLDDVKEMYKRKTGQDVDDEEEEYDLGPKKRVVKSETGIRWIVAGPTPSATALDRKLDDLKRMYRVKTGHNVDSEDEEEGSVFGRNEDVPKSHMNSTPTI